MIDVYNKVVTYNNKTKAYSSSSISGKYAEGSTCFSLWHEKEKTKKDTAKLLTNCIDIFFQMRISDMK